jgi:cell wall-associated NlpC family hydrolase
MAATVKPRAPAARWSGPVKTLAALLWLPIAAATLAQEPAETPGSETPAPAATAAKLSERAANLLFHALSLIGAPYKFGGGDAASGFDCSGFVRHTFAAALDMPLPRSSYAMSRLGQPVERDQLQPGDLLFYNTLKRRFSHVGIYLGDGRFIHAPSRGKQVEIVDMNDRYWQRRFDGARRLLGHAEAAEN